MYRDVHIDSKDVALRNLDERISYLSGARGIDVWRWVRTLSVDQHQNYKKIMTLLTKTVNLIELDIRTIVSLAEVLATLRQCCPSLRSLKVWVNIDSHEALNQVGLFQDIKRLNITILPYLTGEMDPLTDVPSWNMPAVTRFRWEGPWTTSVHETVFVSRCRFPRLTHLEIQLAKVHADLEGIPHICRLLDAHWNITFLSILVKDGDHPSFVPFVRARTFQLFCASRCPPPTIVPLLRPEVKTLVLVFSFFTWEHGKHALSTTLWELLGQFAAQGDTPPTLEAIRLSVKEEKGKLKLVAGKDFLSALRSQALALNARGIRIFVDDDQICI
jgi:hypothetical protein